MPKRSDTTDYPTGRFKAHGNMQLEQSGHLNILKATGPFNKELVVAADHAQEPLYEALLQKVHWGTVLIFCESALATPDAFEALTTILKKRMMQGYAPVAVALVFEPGVEGANLMKSLYLSAYKQAGIDGRVFSDVTAAKEWVGALIQAKLDAIR